MTGDSESGRESLTLPSWARLRQPDCSAVTGAGRSPRRLGLDLAVDLLSLPEQLNHGLFVGRIPEDALGLYSVDELVDLPDEKGGRLPESDRPVSPVTIHGTAVSVKSRIVGDQLVGAAVDPHGHPGAIGDLKHAGQANEFAVPFGLLTGRDLPVDDHVHAGHGHMGDGLGLDFQRQASLPSSGFPLLPLSR